jgi:hypothetical protein
MLHSPDFLAGESITDGRYVDKMHFTFFTQSGR